MIGSGLFFLSFLFAPESRFFFFWRVEFLPEEAIPDCPAPGPIIRVLIVSYSTAFAVQAVHHRSLGRQGYPD